MGRLLERKSVDLSDTDREEDNLAAYFSGIGGMVCVADFEGTFLSLSPVWETTLGWSLDELQSRPFLDFVHPDDCAATIEEMQKLLAGGCTIRFENRYRCKDGSYKCLQWNSTSLVSRRKVYAVAIDVSKQRELEQEVLDAVETERARLGREIHDGLCQHLAGIAALSSGLSNRLRSDTGADAEVNAEMASEIADLLGDGIKQVRAMASGLAPVSIENEGLVNSLKTFCSSIETLFGISCGFATKSKNFRTDAKVEWQLFRIAQEAVHNAIRHGRGKLITLSLAIRGSEGILRVEDDGVGIDSNSEGPGGIGLNTMKYRAHLIGGGLEISSSPGEGTTVACRFPHCEPNYPVSES